MPRWRAEPPHAFHSSLFVMAVQYLSQEGLDKLKQELADLKVRRKELANRMDEARAQGDLSENAEYHEAKDALGLCEGRIMEINEILKNYEVIDADGGAKDRVSIGSTIVVNVNGNKKTYTIVGSNESDPMAGRISNESPIGSALLGARIGEKVDVKTPAGTTVYEIVSIQ